MFACQVKETCYVATFLIPFRLTKVFTTVFKLEMVFLQHLVDPVLFVLTLVSKCLTSHVLKQTLILAESLTSDPYKPGPVKTILSVAWEIRVTENLLN